MKERPILFSAPMVRALLEGRKTQTRRIMKPQTLDGDRLEIGPYAPTKVDRNGDEYPGAEGWGASSEYECIRCPYGQPGDWLWVRETFYAYGYWAKDFGGELGRDVWCFNDKTLESGYEYQFGEVQGVLKRSSGHRGWYRRPAIFMPRVASRITLEITEVRVQRLQEISGHDAYAEGFGFPHFDPASKPGTWGMTELSMIDNFALGFRALHGEDVWDANPWVWVITFKVLSEPKRDGRGCLMPCPKPLLAMDVTDEMWEEIPEHLQEGLARYLDYGVVPGPFLTACLCNDLLQAVLQAPVMLTLAQLRTLAKFMFLCVPRESWGDATKVVMWKENPLRMRLMKERKGNQR